MGDRSRHAYLCFSASCPNMGACTELFLANIHAGTAGWIGVWKALEAVEGLGLMGPAPPFLGPLLSSMMDRGRGQTT